MTDKRLTILFIEVTDGFAGAGNKHELMSRLEQRFRDRLTDYNGVFRKTMEEGFIVTFEDANQALEYAVEIQTSIQSLEADASIRIGVHSGQVTIDDDGDLYGKAVNIAARIQGRSRSDEIYFSNNTYGAIDHDRFNFERMSKGRVDLKGVDERIVLSRVLYDKPGELGSVKSWLFNPLENFKKHPHVKRVSIIAVSMCLLLFVVFTLFMDRPERTTPQRNPSAELNGHGNQQTSGTQEPADKKVPESQVRSTYQMGQPNQYNRLLITRLYNDHQKELFELFNPSSDTQQLLGIFESSPGIERTMDKRDFAVQSVPPCEYVVGYSDLAGENRVKIRTGRTIREDSSFGSEEGLRIVSSVSGDTLLTDSIGWSESPVGHEISRDFFERTPAKIADGTTYALRRKRNEDNYPLDTNNNSRDFELVEEFPGVRTGYTSHECEGN